MTCPDCNQERTSLPYKHDEGGDNERNICAFCTVAYFARNYRCLISEKEKTIVNLTQRKAEFQTGYDALLKGVEEKGPEQYVNDWLASIE